MKAVPFIASFREHFVERPRHGRLPARGLGRRDLAHPRARTFFQERLTKRLFGILAILGMLCLAFASARTTSPTAPRRAWSAFWLWKHADVGTAEATKMSLPVWCWPSAGCCSCWA
jgi:hypothetical protein